MCLLFLQVIIITISGTFCDLSMDHWNVSLLFFFFCSKFLTFNDLYKFTAQCEQYFRSSSSTILVYLFLLLVSHHYSLHIHHYYTFVKRITVTVYCNFTIFSNKLYKVNRVILAGNYGNLLTLFLLF